MGATYTKTHDHFSLFQILHFDCCILCNVTDKIEQQSYHMEDVILMQLFVKQMNDFSQINSVYKSYFPVNPPSRYHYCI